METTDNVELGNMQSGAATVSRAVLINVHMERAVLINVHMETGTAANFSCVMISSHRI
jgi:hypothetical protein